MQIDILSLFPEYFTGPFNESILGRALKNGLAKIDLHNIRDFAEGQHKRVDDRPYGGGPGMVLQPGPVTSAIRSVKTPDSKVIYMSPQGKKLDAKKCAELSKEKHLIILCGHYEGVDQRAIDLEVEEEISIGDYVLSNGCLAAIVLVDSTLRFVSGVLGNELGVQQDSFEDNRLDCPHYTRPPVFEGLDVPQVLLSGNHEDIHQWREDKALLKTRSVRPDLLEREDLECNTCSVASIEEGTETSFEKK